jgi:hypothetical protein
MVKLSHKAQAAQAAQPLATKPPAKGALPMSSKTKAKGASQPRSVPGNTSPVDSMFAWGIHMIRDKIIASCNAGRPFKVDGFGTWTPSPRPDGSVEVQFRPDEALINALNAPIALSALSEHPEKPVPSWITVIDPE